MFRMGRFDFDKVHVPVGSNSKFDTRRSASSRIPMAVSNWRKTIYITERDIWARGPFMLIGLPNTDGILLFFSWKFTAVTINRLVRDFYGDTFHEF